jgi:hypothetical protein
MATAPEALREPLVNRVIRAVQDECRFICETNNLRISA